MDLSQSDVFNMLVQNTSPTAKAVLLILLIFSIGSWGVILSKTMLLRRIRRESDIFWRIFKKGTNLSEIATACEALRFTPLVPVFNAGVAGKKSPSILQRSVQRASASQLTMMESKLPFLATTAAVAPFIGLFGTVWGVLTTFTGLATSNVTTLKAVAPGIADALITTAFGLFTAIPAVIAYNHFLYQIRNLGGQLDDLQAEMLSIVEGNQI